MTGLHDRRGFLRGLAAVPAVGLPLPAAAAEPETELQAAIARYHATAAALLAAEEAVDQASERLDSLGGAPPCPEALYQTGQDFREFQLYAVINEGEPDYRKRFSPTFIEHLRSEPRIWIQQHERPATIEDGLTADEVADGYNKIVWRTKEPWPEAQARADEIVAAWDAWRAERERRLKASGLHAAEATENAACEAWKEARHALVTTRARTMEGALLKLAVVMSLYEGEADLDQELEDRTSKTTLDYRLCLSMARDLNGLARSAASS